MTKYYPQAPTDWTTSLEKIYAKQSEQRRRYHDQLRQRDQQMVTKAQNENIAKVFEGLAGLSTTVGKAVQATQPARDRRNQKKREEALVKFAGDPNKEFILEGARLKYAADKGDALSQKMLDKLISKLKERGNLEAAKAVEKVGPRATVHDKEAMALSLLPSLTEDNFLKELTNNRDFEKLDIYNSSSDPTVKGILLNSWREESLDFLELNDNFKIAVLGKELSRQSESRNNANKNDKNYAIATADQVEIAAQIELRAHDPELLNQYLTELRDRYKTDIPGPIIGEDGKTITVNQQITEKIFKDLYAASLDYKITLNTLDSYLKWGFPHGAGKDGVGTPENVFFTKEQVNQLIAASRTGSTRYIGIQRTKDQAIYKQAELLRQQGKIKEADELMRPVIGRDLLTQEEYADLERINPVEQSKSYEIERDEHYTDLEELGQLPSIEELNREPNIAMRDKWVKIKKDKENWKSKNKFSYDPKNTYSNDISMMINKRSLNPDEVLVGDNGQVLQKLVNYSEMRLSYYLRQDRLNGTETPNIAGLVKADVEQFKIENGWGEDDGPGMFAVDRKTNVGSPRWSNINKISDHFGYGYNHSKPSPNREKSYNQKLLRFSGKTKEERHKLPEGIFSNRQMLGVKENGYFSEDMKYIAAREGLTLAKAFLLSMDSMSTEFKQLFNFEQLPSEVKAKIEAETFIENGLDEALKSPNNRVQLQAVKDIRSKLKYQGWDSFTQNDKILLIQILTALSPQTEAIKEEAEQDDKDLMSANRRDRTLNATE